jgi:integrase
VEWLGAKKQEFAILQRLLVRWRIWEQALAGMDDPRIGTFVRKRDRKPDEAAEYAWRRTDRYPAPATVNRQVIEPLRRVMRRAKKIWGVPVDIDQFQWGGRDGVKRSEPEGRTRELLPSEEAAFWSALPTDYRDICELFIILGKRQSVWLTLQKTSVNLAERTVTARLLKKKRVEFATMEMTEREFEIVCRACAASPKNCDVVFTAVSKSPRDRAIRIPMTPRMLRHAVTNACKTAGIVDFRPHDFRHTFGSRIMRATRDLKVTQQAMDHSSLSSTLRYVHVLQEDVRKARATVTVLRAPDNDLDIQERAQEIPKLDRTAER